MPMGDLARVDEYDPFDAEKFAVPPLDAFATQAAPKDVETLKAIGGAMGELPTLPGRVIGNSANALTTGTYNPAPTLEAAMTVMGGGVGGTGAKAGETALTAGYDPKLWHGVSAIKLPKPIDEMSSILRPVNPAPEVVASPARFQNSLLMPLLGDRTATAASLERVNGFPFEKPVSLEGGHGYMANNPGMAWAAGKSIAPGIAKVAREAGKEGVPVHGVYTAMGERSADFSHMVSDTLAEMAKHTKITPEGEALFNETMRKVSPGFPGISDPGVAQYLRDAPGAVRNVFAKTMDTAPMQKHGFPSVAEARVAVTDPRLLNEPTGAAGLSIARMDPEGRLGPSGHGTYDTGIRGDYVAGLPASVPKEVMFPDVLGPLSTHADAVAQARVEAGLKPFRPTEDYLMSRMPKGLPKFQEANQQWVDSVSKHLEDRGFTLGSGATDKKGAAAIQGIRAYHSSPHDFDRFDLSKIGTGEGAQVYGHGLYFAENPAVSGQGGQYWQQFLGRFPEPEQKAASRLRAEGFDRNAAAAANQRDIDDWAREVKRYQEMPDSAKSIDDWNRQAQALKMFEERSAQYKLLQGDKPVGPRTYEVNINADPAHMLDWDKPLTHYEKQLDPVLRDLKMPEARNLDFNSVPELLETFGDKGKAARLSAALSEGGIPGIKYLDEGSRAIPTKIQWAKDALANPRIPDVHDKAREALARWGATPVTSNYVVFDPSIVNIMKKYGIAGAAPAGMGALAATGNYQPEERY
jgi:hypothetical protein